MPMQKSFIILFILFFTSKLIFPQKTNIKFEHLSVEQGLSHTTVKSIFQDSKGFMWFGTEDGLNKFDGYKFTVYRYDPDDSTTISFNEVLDIYEDQSNNLWIATCGGGLNMFNRQTETFIRYTYNPVNKSSLPTDSLYCLTGFEYDFFFWTQV